MNCRKLRLGLLLVAGLCLCLVLMARVEAQLNFSTGWGKRSPGAFELLGERHPDGSAFRGGLPDREQLMRLYRRLRKIEVQRHVNPQM